MPVEKSIKAFKDERLNCAQSIMRGFQEQKNISEQAISDAKSLGGGRADAGNCGALHAALQLTGDDDKVCEVLNNFVEKAGSGRCREIRKKKILSCAQCVELAAKLLVGQD